MNHSITIFSPREGQRYSWTAGVFGQVQCFDHKHETVQAMVHAADDLWYPQPQVMYEPWGYFVVGVKLGFKDDPHQDFYTIAVGVGGEKILKPVKVLPENVLWTTVNVERI